MSLPSSTPTDATNAYALSTNVSTFKSVWMASRTGKPISVLINLSAFSHHIVGVIQSSTIKNMIRVYARWIIASMASKIIGILSVLNKVSNTMGWNYSLKTVIPQGSIASVVFVSKPFPASIIRTFNNFSPKSFLNRDRGRSKFMFLHNIRIPSQTRVCKLRWAV